eukprot:COSAG06_NODE_196_length_20472_cov_49.724207_24_plen_57_part_00
MEVHLRKLFVRAHADTNVPAAIIRAENAPFLEPFLSSKDDLYAKTGSGQIQEMRCC